MALSKDDRARLIRSGRLARTALAAARIGSRTAPHHDDGPATPLADEFQAGDVVNYLRGALVVEDAGDGLVQPYRFSKKQLRYLESVGRGRRARATSGICLALVTTGDEVSFDCRVTGALDPSNPLYAEVMGRLGDLGKAEDGLVDGIDVVVGGGQAHTVAVRDGRISVSFDNPEHVPAEVRVYLPLIMSVAVGRLASNGTTSPAPRRRYLLALGDSITQGFVVGCPSLSYPALLSAELGLDLVNQAVCGYVFDQGTLAGMKALRNEPPAAITVAYGTNDWGRKGTGKEIRRDTAAYLERLCKLFPATPIYVLTPLWRAEEDAAALAGIPSGKSLAWVRHAIERACRDLDNVTLVDGTNILPRNPLMFADGRLHPGSTGAAIVAEALADAMRAGGIDARREEPVALGASEHAAPAPDAEIEKSPLPSGHRNMQLRHPMPRRAGLTPSTPRASRARAFRARTPSSTASCARSGVCARRTAAHGTASRRTSRLCATWSRRPTRLPRPCAQVTPPTWRRSLVTCSTRLFSTLRWLRRRALSPSTTCAAL